MYNDEEEILKQAILREQKKLWAKALRLKLKGEILTADEEQMVVQKKKADLEKYRESKRIWAKKNREKLKAELGTCLTEQQKIHNLNYRLAHYEECKAKQRVYQKKLRELAKKAKSIKRNDCECQTDQVLDSESLQLASRSDTARLDDVEDNFTINVISV